MLDQRRARRARRRPDRCPGVTRPWIADDGALVRVRLVGGRLPTSALAALARLAAEHGDGDLHLTSRANLQLRGVTHRDGVLPAGLVEAIREAGLLPSPTHELVRNVMVSPLSGCSGGLADVRPVAAELDRLLLADPACAALAGRFLFLLDDGRGDLVDRSSDLAAVALDADTAQLRAADAQWGPVVPLDAAAVALHRAARRFLDLHGAGPTAAWHVEELLAPLWSLDRDPRWPGSTEPPTPGALRQQDGRIAELVDVPEGLVTPELAQRLLARAGREVVVTPWHSVLVPDLEDR